MASRGMAAINWLTPTRSSRESPASGSSSSSTFRLLRQRHGDFDAPLFAIGDFGDRAVREMIEPDAAEHASGLDDTDRRSRQAGGTYSSAAGQPEQRQRDVVLERVPGKQRDDLVGAREPAVRALVRPQARDVFPEQLDACRSRLACRR